MIFPPACLESRSLQAFDKQRYAVARASREDEGVKALAKRVMSSIDKEGEDASRFRRTSRAASSICTFIPFILFKRKELQRCFRFRTKSKEGAIRVVEY